MAKKIEIIGNALVITNTVTNEIVAESPKQLVYYNVDRLEKGVVEVINIDSTNQVQLSFEAMAIGADTVDSGDTPFTISTFRTFARTNLGN